VKLIPELAKYTLRLRMAPEKWGVQPVIPSGLKSLQNIRTPNKTFLYCLCLHVFTSWGATIFPLAKWKHQVFFLQVMQNIRDFKADLLRMKRLAVNYFSTLKWKNFPLAGIACVSLPSFYTSVHCHWQMFNDTDVISIHFWLTHTLIIRILIKTVNFCFKRDNSLWT